MSAMGPDLDTPLGRRELTDRWADLCVDPTYEDVAGKIELNEWGEILLSPVGKTHGLLASELGERLRAALGGRTMVEVGVLTDLGVRVPDLAWCSAEYLAAHPEEAPLTSAPELCIEIASPTHSIVKLREKAAAYVRAGAREGWILVPVRREIEIYGVTARLGTTAFPIDLAKVF